MKRLFVSVIGIGVLGLLMGCGCYQPRYYQYQASCQSCGSCCPSCSTCYYDYPSQCGDYSCTKDGLVNYSNPCPGPYNCNDP